MPTLFRTALVAAMALLAAGSLPAAAEPDGQTLVNAQVDPTPLGILQQIGAPQAWPYSRGAGVTVAVLDAGVALQHPELDGRAALNAVEALGKPGVDDDGNGLIDDTLGWDFADNDNEPWLFAGSPSTGSGRDGDGDGHADSGVSHGTYVAGLIAGKTMGVAPEARILPVRIADDEGRGIPTNLAAGIDYAWGRGARVIYIGVGLPDDDVAVRAAVSRATAAGALLVAPAGNTINIQYPAAYASVLSVGSTENGGPAPYSAWGAGVDIAAPGTRLYAPRVAPVTAELGYGRVTGTSYSAALVAGAAALLRGAAPWLTSQAAAQYLMTSADPLSSGGGIGTLDVGRAIHLATGR